MSGQDASGARIFLADDHPAVIEGLTLLLAQERHEVCGVAGSRDEALLLLPESRPDLALVDLGLCGESGLDLLPELLALGVPALVYTMHEDAATVQNALSRGAVGYVTKRETSAVLLEAVRKVRGGERYVSPRAAANLAAAGGFLLSQALSERERQILKLLASGETNSEIAQTLQVSLRTVETYFSRILAKLDLDGMKALRKYALHHFRPV
ncbi:MAG TPA: response regulator transcription factor [Humidesulfovibrio sp.]|uniref:response regulator transcription factor n=1 Tax=Humidesulfovibrio sp. TaxID=2910988 RepID=UPI002CA5DCA6|nr:response regulator transcription factor [Humidesulfovibrio sp.]HWR04784.1 response regulator transcription factor [Humidesulfovibrio sp.]